MTNVFHWLILLLAGLFEIAWAIGLKYSQGFSKPLPSVLTVISMVISMGLLAYCLKFLPVGTAYAVWTGVGAAGTAILGIYLFSEPANLPRLMFIGLIIIGIIGLKFTA
ncbi:MAG: quaternary ammonium compound efflux SMR transporter SugE [Ignavibacteriaceae bacterium]|nr:quaternary ammonium compound efflux SMR transporter SugE [Ignavibacteriaceae bacterium]